MVSIYWKSQSRAYFIYPHNCTMWYVLSPSLLHWLRSCCCLTSDLELNTGFTCCWTKGHSNMIELYPIFTKTSNYYTNFKNKAMKSLMWPGMTSLTLLVRSQQTLSRQSSCFIPSVCHELSRVWKMPSKSQLFTNRVSRWHHWKAASVTLRHCWRLMPVWRAFPRWSEQKPCVSFSYFLLLSVT